MPADPPKTSPKTLTDRPRAASEGQLLDFGRRRVGPAASPCLERPPELRAFAANDQVAAPGHPAEPHDLSGFRAEVAPLLAVLGYHLADPTVMAAPAFVERRKAPSTLDRLTELEAQIARDGDPSGLRHRLRRLLLAELELLGVVGRRREDRPLAEAAARALRG